MHHPTLRKVPSIKGKSWTSSLFNLAGCYQNLTPSMRKLPTEVQKDVMHMATLKTSYSYMQILVSTKHVFCHFSCMVARFGQPNAVIYIIWNISIKNSRVILWKYYGDQVYPIPLCYNEQTFWASSMDMKQRFRWAGHWVCVEDGRLSK